MSKVKESTELREKQLEDAAWAISQLEDVAWAISHLGDATWDISRLEDATWAISQIKDVARSMSQLEDAAWAISQRNVQLRSFLLRLLDPNDLGHNVTQEVRELVNKVLVTPR